MTTPFSDHSRRSGRCSSDGRLLPAELDRHAFGGERGDVNGPSSVNLMVGLGAERGRAEKALADAVEATAEHFA